MRGEKGKPVGPRAAKRGVWFFMRTILLVTAFCALCYGIFMMAMDASNLYIIATEGMQLRAECVLKDGPEEELSVYFTEAYLSRDSLLSSTKYNDYTINNYDYRVSVSSITAWPWSDTATMVVTERMASLNGTMLEEKKPENAPEGATYPVPEWDGGRYRLHFINKDGRWFIQQVVLLEASPSEVPLRTPDMCLTPLPAYTTPPPSTTPTPKVTPSPSPTPTPTNTPGEEVGQEE